MNNFVNIYGSCTEIWSGVRIASFVEIGSTDDHPTIIEKNVIISAFCFICPGVHIGHDSFIGPNVVFTNDHNPPSKKKLGDEREWKFTWVGNNVSIGAGSIIMPGVTIGDNVIIGAGSLVLHDVPSNTTYYNKRTEVCYATTSI